MNWTPIKLQVDGHLIRSHMADEGGRIFLKFPFHKGLLREVKAMQGAKWNPDEKMWHFPRSERNSFALQALMGINVFARYDAPLVDFEPLWPLYGYQKEMVRFGLTRRQCILAAEMGLGKTRVAFAIAQASGIKKIYYVGPNSALISAKVEQRRLVGLTVDIQYETYDSLKKLLKLWPDSDPAPKFLICDESVKVKDHKTMRAQAVDHLASNMRAEWGDDCYIILLSGSPAPKSPVDWYNQCEIARPGFLREGDVVKFKNRLCWQEQSESATGGTFSKLIGWKDNPELCDVCGKPEDHYYHPTDHVYVKSVNEISLLYERLQGLVLVKRKADCLDLPPLRFERIYCKPEAATLRALSFIKNTTSRGVDALMKARELSDGFQYKEVPSGTFHTCPACNGSGTQIVTYHENGDADQSAPCEMCKGEGKLPDMIRTEVRTYTAKDEKLKLLLEHHEEVGRLVIGAGFTASVDKVTMICQEAGWHVIKADGRGWKFLAPDQSVLPVGKPEDMVGIFQDGQETYPRVVVVGNPATIGEGLTLTASPSIVRYSNTFNGNDHIQFMHRIHRPGMDVNRGATIYDLIHLPTDEYVLDNLERKVDLQNQSLGVIPTEFTGDRSR